MTDSLWWQRIPRNTNPVNREQGEIVKQATELMELLDEVVPNSTIHYAVEQARMKLHQLIRTAHGVKTEEQTCQECSKPLGDVHGGCCDTGRDGELVILADTHRLESCRICQKELGKGHALRCIHEGTVEWEQTVQSADGAVVTVRPEPTGECAFTKAAHHSTDRVEVYHGRLEPLVLCGFHAQPVWLTDAINWCTTQTIIDNTKAQEEGK